MQAPETVKLRYVGITNVKQIYRGYDGGLKQLVYFDSTGEKHPSESDVSMEFAKRALKKFPDEFKVDELFLERVRGWKPPEKGVPVGSASKNIQIRYPDGTMQEFPPGSIISVRPPDTIVEVPEVKEESSKVEDPATITRKELDKLSKPKIARWAKANVELEIDPGSMSKIEMVDTVIDALE